MPGVPRTDWMESAWNPVVGCSKTSAGCKNCLAEREAHRLAYEAQLAQQAGRDPDAEIDHRSVVNHLGRWNNELFLNEAALTEPLTWKAPRFVVVNAMSDLFHERVPIDYIQRVFEVMETTPQHTYQLLTKRPRRAANLWSRLPQLTNVWMGTTVENSLVRDRVGQLGRIDAPVRFLAMEPLLGPLPTLSLKDIHWVIVGGERGPGARAINRDWVRQIRDRCLAQGVPFHFKGWGGEGVGTGSRDLDGRTWDETPIVDRGQRAQSS
jgi:protein gp37